MQNTTLNQNSDHSDNYAENASARAVTSSTTCNTSNTTNDPSSSCSAQAPISQGQPLSQHAQPPVLYPDRNLPQPVQDLSSYPRNLYDQELIS